MTMVPLFVADFGMLSELNVHVALSFCDIEGAIQNLNAEAPDFDFDRFKGEAERRWDDQLGRIPVDGGTSDERTTFYTAFVPRHHGAQPRKRRGWPIPRDRFARSRARGRRRRPLHRVQLVGHLPGAPPFACVDRAQPYA